MEKSELREAVQKTRQHKFTLKFIFEKTCMRVCFCAPKIEGRFSSAGTQSDQIYNIMEIMLILIVVSDK